MDAHTVDTIVTVILTIMFFVGGMVWVNEIRSKQCDMLAQEMIETSKRMPNFFGDCTQEENYARLRNFVLATRAMQQTKK